MKLNIEYVPIGSIAEYPNNAKLHPDDQVEQIKESIKEFGFNDPIAIWKNGEVIEGHGRLLAARELGMKKVPVIRLDKLSDKKRRAYMLVHNQLTLNSKYDNSILELELEGIEDIDMEMFGFEMPELEMPIMYGEERLRTDRAYHLDKLSELELSEDFWQMPVIECQDHIPKELIGFNYAKTYKDKSVGIHFFVDDYQFERVWNYPDKYIDVLKEYDCIISPDFSLYVDMPMPMKIWNTYRSRYIGAYYQSKGITVIPDINWAYEDTYCFCFEGIPKGSIIACSTVSVKKDPEMRDMFFRGMDECIRRIEPKTIIEYGGDIGYDYGEIGLVRIGNKMLKDWRLRVG